MKIIQFLHGGNLGGMEKFCIDLSNALAEEHEVLFLGNQKFKQHLTNNVFFQRLEVQKGRRNPFFLFKIYQIIKRFSPDIIHAHKQKSISILKYLDFFLSVPYVATKHDIQNKKVFNRLKHVISISDVVTKTLKAKNVYKIYNGIPLKQPKKVELPNTFNMVAIGGLREVKGFDKLIKTVSSLQFDFYLTIIGEGDERQYLEDLIHKLNMESNISLIGFKSNVEDYLHSADLQIISSVSEGFSLAMVEGIFYTKILISTKVSGCDEILSEKLLYNMTELKDKITDIYENYNFYENEFQKVKEIYKKDLTIQKCAENYLDVYKKVIANN